MVLAIFGAAGALINPQSGYIMISSVISLGSTGLAAIFDPGGNTSARLTMDFISIFGTIGSPYPVPALAAIYNILFDFLTMGNGTTPCSVGDDSFYGS